MPAGSFTAWVIEQASGETTTTLWFHEDACGTVKTSTPDVQGRTTTSELTSYDC